MAKPLHSLITICLFIPLLHSFCITPPSQKNWGIARGGGDNESRLHAATTSATVSEQNLELLSERGREAVLKLMEYDGENGGYQRHVYGDWPDVGIEDEGKIQLAEQLADLDEAYPGGLTKYISKARKLLEESSKNLNPFEGFTPSVPDGERLCYENKLPDEHTGMTFSEAEQSGLSGIADVAFVLVAGGLGERLGYSGIKLSLETNLCTNKSYLEVYIKYIQAMQSMAEKKNNLKEVRIPLVIMTSGDTDAQTRELLKTHDNFGMSDDQIHIMMQEKVPALKDSNAGLSYDKSQWKIDTKPHGHGDVHQLLVKNGYIRKWREEGRKHVIFLQDTNVLVINSVLPALGVSIAKKFHMNTICVPRLAGEPAGAIARLNHCSDPSKSLVINVEYNQLDPLLRSSGAKGDVPNPATGYSPYPGNSNILLLELDAYAKTLAGEDQGVVNEFVNPKYQQGSRTQFKKPTRLECMMQDLPKLMQKELGTHANIGFTMFERWFTFSPAKNSLEAGAGASPPDTVSSAESDKYIQNQRKLRLAGVDLPVTERPEDHVHIAGIPVTPGPRVVLCPGFAITQEEMFYKILDSGKITQRSCLVLEGEVILKNLDLDGSLVIRAAKGCEVHVDNLTVRNKGWEIQELEEGVSYPEHVRIRGYTMDKKEALEILVTEPGKYVVDKHGNVNKVE